MPEGYNNNLKTEQWINLLNIFNAVTGKLKNTGFPKDYTAADFRRNQDIFHKWVRQNYPECMIIGPIDTAPNTRTFNKIYQARCCSK